MLGNCEKMIDEKVIMDSKVMEKPNQPHQQQQHQQQQQPLKCPRCDSSNTKFCYYNNYSLSQPRHFCKACKRYWTRGGTLRNVPVGGGCRKNKRIKRQISTSNEAANSSSAQETITSSIPSVLPPSHINPLFYSLLSSTNHQTSELNNILPYPRFNSRVLSMDSVNGYDLEPLLNDLGSGFSSGLLASDVMNKQIIQDAVLPSNSLLSSYNPLICGSTPTSTMASLIASSLHQEKINVFGGLKDAQESNNFQGFEQFEDMQMAARNSEGSLAVKDVKMEEGYNRLDWSNVANANNQNHIEQINSTSPDPSLLWNGAWLDPSNVGSSVPSLI